MIRSQHGFKIGETRRLKERTRLFEGKLPLPISVEMTGWFADYLQAERRFHRLFHARRLEGEWFALEEPDQATLRAEMRPGPVATWCARQIPKDSRRLR